MTEFLFQVTVESILRKPLYKNMSSKRKCPTIMQRSVSLLDGAAARSRLAWLSCRRSELISVSSFATEVTEGAERVSCAATTERK